MNAVKSPQKGNLTQPNGKQRRPKNHQESRNREKSRKRDGKCRNCGGIYPHRDSRPAKNKKCTSCGKLNHFAQVCRTNPPESANQVTHRDTDVEDEYVYTVGRDKQPMSQVKIDEKQVEMMVYSVESVDLIDENTFRELYKEKSPEKTKRKIFPCGSPTPLPLLGTVKAEIPANAKGTQTTLHIVKGASGNLLGFYTAKQIGVLKIVNQVKTNKTRFQSPHEQGIRKSVWRNRQSKRKRYQASHRP